MGSDESGNPLNDANGKPYGYDKWNLDQTALDEYLATPEAFKGADILKKGVHTRYVQEDDGRHTDSQHYYIQGPSTMRDAYNFQEVNARQAVDSLAAFNTWLGDRKKTVEEFNDRAKRAGDHPGRAQTILGFNQSAKTVLG